MTDGEAVDGASGPLAADAESPLMRVVHRIGWPRIRLAAAVVYGLVLLAIVVSVGVPTGRQTIAVLIVVGLSISSLGHGWRRLAQVIADWLPFTLVLMAYDRTRAIADVIGMPLHQADVVSAERWLFGGTIPTVWLQEHLYNPRHVYWYDALITLIYTSHFLATPILAAFLWLRERRAWMQFISRVIVLSIAGLITYILFPEAPPWLASQDGDISQHIARLSARGWIFLHLGNINQALAHAQDAGSNPVAAMPSLHIAFASLVALFIGSRLRTKWRWLLVLYPIGMGFTLVYAGEHYVIDLIGGVVYALVVHLGMNRWERHRAQRHEADRAPESGALVPSMR